MARISTMACMLALAVSLAGCGEDYPDRDTNTRFVALHARVRHLDPAIVNDTTSASVAGNIFDRLYQYKYLVRPAELQPGIAAAMPEVSDDGLVYTIRLREDVFFHDDACFPDGKGRQVVAQDFVYSWKRIADVTNASPNYSFIEGRIKGFDEFRKYTHERSDAGEPIDYATPVAGLEALDDHTLQITLTAPWPSILYAIEHLPFTPMPREAVEHYGKRIINVAVGTGPYKLERWDQGSRIVLVRNENYRHDPYPSEGEPGDKEKGLLADAGKPMPFIDRVEFEIIEEDQPYWLTFDKGLIDSAGIPKDTFSNVVGAGQKLKPKWAKRGIELIIYDYPATEWLAFNMKDPVVGKNLALRQAISLAIDREDFIELFRNGRGTPAVGPTHPMISGGNDYLHSPYHRYDVEAAKAKLKEAEAFHGGPLPELAFTMGGTDTSARQYAEWVERSVEKIGLDVKIDLMDWPTQQEQVDNAALQFWRYGWHADYADPENYMFLYYSPNHAPGPNSTNYANPEFDKLFERFVTTPHGPQRTALHHQMEQLVVDDMPAVFTMYSIAYVLRHPWLENYKPHPIMWGTLKYQKVNVAKRWEMLTGKTLEE